MLKPALATQYSGREMLAKVLEIEVMNTICGSAIVPAAISSIIARATAWVRKNGPRRLVARTRSQLSGVVSRRSEPLQRGDAGIVDPEVDTAVSRRASHRAVGAPAPGRPRRRGSRSRSAIHAFRLRGMLDQRPAASVR